MISPSGGCSLGSVTPTGVRSLSQGSIGSDDDKRMRLRYAGICRLCGVDLPVGQFAIYERSRKTVRCDGCPGAPPDTQTTEADVAVHRHVGTGASADAVQQTAIDSGVPGASARREHERRRAKREANVRATHPRIGGLILALQSDPQSTTAWATGAEGEERFGARLNAIASDDVRVLHDRRIPKTRANIDHLVVCPTGVIVIDAKKYKGRPQLRIEGGILRARTETLMVGSRNCTKLVDGVLHQVELVRSTLESQGLWASPPVRGMLCFVEADWPLIGGSFTTRGVEALWQRRAIAQIAKPGPLEPEFIAAVHRHLATSFPPA
jgi:hypothetical protein